MGAVILSNNNTFGKIGISTKCEFDGKKCSSKQKWNNDKFQCECKIPMKHSIKEEDFA